MNFKNFFPFCPLNEEFRGQTERRIYGIREAYSAAIYGSGASAILSINHRPRRFYPVSRGPEHKRGKSTILSISIKEEEKT